MSSASHSSAAAGAAAAAAAASNEETRQAVLLFAIVTFFLFFNTPRNFMNLYEVARFDQVWGEKNAKSKYLKPFFRFVVATFKRLST